MPPLHQINRQKGGAPPPAARKPPPGRGNGAAPRNPPGAGATPGPEADAAPGSVLSEAIPVGALPDDWIKMVIYGPNRVGKTTLACEFPKPLLLVCFEPTVTGGAKSVKRCPGVTYLRVESSDKGHRLARELAQRCPFATVVLDSATSYQDIILQEILDLPEVPTQLNWGTVSQDQYRQRSERTREALRPFLALPCHTVVIAKERDHNPPDREKPKILRGEHEGSFFASDLGGATVGWLHDACDYIGRLHMAKETRVLGVPAGTGGEVAREVVETGRVVRRLRTMYHPNYMAGMRSCDPRSVPEWIEAETPKQMYDAIVRVIDGTYQVGGPKGPRP